jgi:hypothetical protein
MRRIVLVTFVSLIVVVVVAATGAGAASPAPARVRFVHTVAGAGPVDIVVMGGPVLVRDLGYPQSSPYISVPPGTYNIELLASGTQTVLVRILGWTAVSGVSTTVRLIRDMSGTLDVSPMTDRATDPSLPLTGASSAKLALFALSLISVGAVLCVLASQGRSAALAAGSTRQPGKALR